MYVPKRLLEPWISSKLTFLDSALILYSLGTKLLRGFIYFSCTAIGARSSFGIVASFIKL